MVMNKLLLLLIIFCSCCLAQQVYLSTDKNGIPLYSDRPLSGSKKLDLKVSRQSLAFQPTAAPLSVNSLTGQPAPYQVVIVTPAHQATVISNQGEVLVQSSISPALAEQHHLRLVLDQQQQSPLQQSPNFRLLGVERGEHQLQLQLLDQNGKLIAESTVTTFYLRKTTIISPK
jgi:hypothetical protein